MYYLNQGAFMGGGALLGAEHGLPLGMGNLSSGIFI